MEVWAENIKTKECWKLDYDSSKPIYYDYKGHTVMSLEDVSKYRFYPICPKEAPVFEVPEHGDQMTIFDFMEGAKDD